VQGIRQVLNNAAIQPDEILAVGVDTQMHACIPLDQLGNLLSHRVQLWCDKRGSGLMDELASHPFMSSASAFAGTPPVANWLGFKIKWLKTYQAEIYAKTWKILTGEGFINYRLTGELAMDWTEATGSFLLDSRSLQWSPELAEFLQVELEKLPPAVKSTAVIGRITPQAAQATGLAEGIPVVAGAGDMLAMLVAAGLVEIGHAVDVSGTASNLVFLVASPVREPPLTNLHHALEGWCPFSTVETGGGALRWFRDLLAQSESQSGELEGLTSYQRLSEQAARCEYGSEGLLFLPYMMGERVLGTPQARGVLFGLTPRTDRGAIVRSMMEGITFELRRALEFVEQAGNSIRGIYTTGGGARSDLWSQIKADIYKRPVHTLAIDEGGVLGSAILAMVGIGFYADFQTAINECVRFARTFHPNPETFPRYDYLFERFKQLHEKLQDDFNRLAGMP
jgi:xylulokinase